MPPEATSPCETLPGVVTARTRVRVLLPLPLAGAYDYAVPDDLAVAPGDFVVAPLGRNSFAGVVWDGEPQGPETKTVDDSKLPALSPAQRSAADALVAAVDRAAFGVTVLDGVTGSGKTEVYFEAIAAALQRDKQVLVLLPEIALSVQWLERFARRFGVRPAAWHSELTGKQRRATWRQIARGDVSVVVGARSALFLPLPKLGLIVVDEEHYGSYKQGDGGIYHARDMAGDARRLIHGPGLL